MRIAVFAPEPGSKDGIAAQTQRIVDAWQRAGHEVIWLYPHNGICAVAHGQQRAPVDVRAHAALRAFAPDLLVVQFAVPAVRTSLAALVLLARALKRRGVAVVFCCHEASRELALLGPVCRLIYCALRWAGSGFIAFSEVEARAMVQSGLAAAVATVPHGVEHPQVGSSELERVRAAYELRPPVVLALGWITASKGTDLLIGAMPEVAAAVGQVQCVVAGEVRPREGIFRIFGRADQRFAAALAETAAASRGRAQIRMVGYVPDQDLGALMAAATVVVLPYRSVTQSGIAARAAAAATPIVASKLPGMVAQLGAAARYFEPGDTRDLARVLSQVLADQSLRSEMAAAARARTAEESYEQVAVAILAAARG